MIEMEKRKLVSQVDMEESEKNKIEMQLAKKESDLKRAQQEQDALQERLEALKRKVLVGGVDLLEKAQEQERLLEESAKELQARQAKEEELKKRLKQKEAEQKKAEEKFSNMQEEAEVKTRALKKAFHQLMSAKSEVCSHSVFPSFISIIWAVFASGFNTLDVNVTVLLIKLSKVCETVAGDQDLETENEDRKR